MDYELTSYNKSGLFGIKFKVKEVTGFGWVHDDWGDGHSTLETKWTEKIITGSIFTEVHHIDQSTCFIKRNGKWGIIYLFPLTDYSTEPDSESTIWQDKFVSGKNPVNGYESFTRYKCVYIRIPKYKEFVPFKDGTILVKRLLKYQLFKLSTNGEIYNRKSISKANASLMVQNNEYYLASTTL